MKNIKYFISGKESYKWCTNNTDKKIIDIKLLSYVWEITYED
jgi:hypothetical protein